MAVSGYLRASISNPIKNHINDWGGATSQLESKNGNDILLFGFSFETPNGNDEALRRQEETYYGDWLRAKQKKQGKLP